MAFYEDSVRDCQLSVLDDLPPAEVLLDYGCGSGELTRRFADRAGAVRVLGVEVVDGLIRGRHAREGSRSSPSRTGK